MSGRHGVGDVLAGLSGKSDLWVSYFFRFFLWGCRESLIFRFPVFVGDINEMIMKDEKWFPLCALVSQLHCWVRVTCREGASTQEGWWGQLLTMPVDGYLEAAGGPIPLQDVEWVEVSTSRIKGGIAGRPRQMIDVKEEILSGLRRTQLSWQIRDSTWSVAGLFEEEPVQVVRIVNPFVDNS